MALHKIDFDGEVFTIRRTFSARRLTDSTKTGEIHHIPIRDMDQRYDVVEDSDKLAAIRLLETYRAETQNSQIVTKPVTK